MATKPMRELMAPLRHGQNRPKPLPIDAATSIVRSVRNGTRLCPYAQPASPLMRMT
jgi:hypothetical protein